MAGGWAKLDIESAINLVEIVDGFQRNRGTQARILLVLFTFTRDGRVSVGARTLAKAAGVTYKQARGVMEKLEDAGWLISEGTRKTSAGEYTVRRWAWADDAEGCANNGELGAQGVRPSRGAPYANNYGDKGAPYALKPGFKGAHKTLQREESTGGDADASRALEILREVGGCEPWIPKEPRRPE